MLLASSPLARATTSRSRPDSHPGYTASAAVEGSELACAGDVPCSAARVNQRTACLVQLHSLVPWHSEGRGVLSGGISLLGHFENLLEGSGFDRCGGRTQLERVRGGAD